MSKKITIDMEKIIQEHVEEKLWFELGDIFREVQDELAQREKEVVKDMAKKVTQQVLEAINQKEKQDGK